MEEDIGEEETQSTEGKIHWVHGETQMQWISTEEKEEIGHVITVESGAIWPETVRRKIEQE